jgi:hypothetical protein
VAQVARARLVLAQDTALPRGVGALRQTLLAAAGQRHISQPGPKADCGRLAVQRVGAQLPLGEV